MWIRSQGSHAMMFVELFQVFDDKNTKIWYIKGITGQNERKLGKYSTEEKALKVLDMVEKLIKGKRESYYSFKDNKEIINHYYYPNKEQLVFQMPLDEEV